MMVDLYGLPTDFPGYDAGMSRQTGMEQAAALEAALAEEIGDPRFLPYLQVHEFEALVLCDPARLGTVYEVPPVVLESLCRECGSYASPEEINLGQHSHPKYRIRQRVAGYDENIAGPLLAESIGLEVLRAACPHFGSWLTRLEGLEGAGARR